MNKKLFSELVGEHLYKKTAKDQIAMFNQLPGVLGILFFKDTPLKSVQTHIKKRIKQEEDSKKAVIKAREEEIKKYATEMLKSLSAPDLLKILSTSKTVNKIRYSGSKEKPNAVRIRFVKHLGKPIKKLVKKTA